MPEQMDIYMQKETVFITHSVHKNQLEINHMPEHKTIKLTEKRKKILMTLV